MCYGRLMPRKKRDFQQERSERTYRAILEAAATVFPKKGFEGTQMSDIADAVGLSVGAVYRYFDDKRELFLEMVETELAATRADINARFTPENFIGSTPEDAVAGVLDILFDRVKKDAAMTRVYLAMSMSDPDVAKIRKDGEIHDRALLANVIRAVTAGTIGDADAAALVIERAVIGAAVDCVIGTKVVSEAAAKAALQKMIVRYLLGGPPSTSTAAPKQR